VRTFRRGPSSPRTRIGVPPAPRDPHFARHPFRGGRPRRR
jgi:hypothetical protein